MALVNCESLMPLREDALDLDVTSLHHRRAVHRWERMSVGDLIERVTWSRPDKLAIIDAELWTIARAPFGRRDPRRRHLGDPRHARHHGAAQGRDDLARLQLR